MIELITTIGMLSVAIYLLILLYVIIGIIRTKEDLTDEQSFVTVIVAAHNESHNIAACLDSILKQDYPHEKMEIIVVNDRSEDNTGLILNEYEKNNTLIRVLTISEYEPGLSPKKNALTQAIKLATGEIIATTDADCEAPIQWLKRGVSYFTSETGMVVGLAPLKPTSWWLSPYICLDALTADILSYGSFGWGHAVACTGRNFAYRKSVFMEVNGFSGIDHIITGDDDLFLQKVAKKTNWKIQFSSELESSVSSDAPYGWTHFITQRKRHISGAKYFSFPVQLSYTLYFFSKLFIMLTFIVFLTNNIETFIPIMLLLFSYFSTAMFIYVMARKTNQIRLIIYYPLWEIYYLICHIFLGPLGLLGKISWGKR